MAVIYRQDQEIILYAPTTQIVGLVCFGWGICVPFGILLLFLGKGQVIPLLASLLFLLSGVWSGGVFPWRLRQRPILLITTEGICRQNLFSRFLIRWEEIDAIYRGGRGAFFSVDASPSGLIALSTRYGKPLPRNMDITVPQEALALPRSNLPVPVEQVLVQIRERFAAQIERYHIEVLDGSEGSTQLGEDAP